MKVPSEVGYQTGSYDALHLTPEISILSLKREVVRDIARLRLVEMRQQGYAAVMDREHDEAFLDSYVEGYCLMVEQIIHSAAFLIRFFLNQLLLDVTDVVDVA